MFVDYVLFSDSSSVQSVRSDWSDWSDWCLWIMCCSVTPSLFSQFDQRTTMSLWSCKNQLERSEEPLGRWGTGENLSSKILNQFWISIKFEFWINSEFWYFHVSGTPTCLNSIQNVGQQSACQRTHTGGYQAIIPVRRLKRVWLVSSWNWFSCPLI